ASPTAGPTAKPTPTPGLPAVNGKPLSLSDLQREWGSKGLDVRAGGGAGGFGGFAVTPADVQLSGGGGSMEVAVLVYPDAQAIKADWSLSAGAAPSPAGGRTVPAGGSIWWNQNVIVVTRSGSGSVVSSAREAFLGLRGPRSTHRPHSVLDADGDHPAAADADGAVQPVVLLG